MIGNLELPGIVQIFRCPAANRSGDASGNPGYAKRHKMIAHEVRFPARACNSGSGQETAQGNHILNKLAVIYAIGYIKIAFMGANARNGNANLDAREFAHQPPGMQTTGKGVPLEGFQTEQGAKSY